MDRDRDFGMGMGMMNVRDAGRKEELVDVSYMEKLKKFIGDPFDESMLQKASLQQ